MDVLQHGDDGGRLGQARCAIRVKAHQRVSTRLGQLDVARCKRIATIKARGAVAQQIRNI